MTNPEHLLVGMASATAFYSAMHFCGNKEKKSFGLGKILFVMAVAANISDIDALWGNYTSKDPWTGHRGMTHSFMGVALLGLGITIATNVFAVVLRLIPAYWCFLFNYFKKKEFDLDSSEFSFFKYLSNPFHPKPFLILFLAAFIGGVTHLICDMPQAGSVWEGLPLFFPFKNAAGDYSRYGGWGLIGWYDFKTAWLLLGTVAVSIPAVLIGRFINLFKIKVIKILTVCWFAAIFLFNCGIFYWSFNYIRTSTYKNDQQWYSYQMKWLDTEAPELIKKTSKEAFKIGLSIFRQSRGLNG